MLKKFVERQSKSKMAKFIEGRDGSRMLVSDDAPDDIDTGDTSWIKPMDSIPPPLTKIDPASILLCFTDENLPIVPIQADKFVVDDMKCKLVGTMLLVDYAWLLGKHTITQVDHLEIRIEERIYKIAEGPLMITRFVGKDINATTVNVHLSFKRYI